MVDTVVDITDTAKIKSAILLQGSKLRYLEYLTRREKQMVELLSYGYTEGQIANTLQISHSTVSRTMVLLRQKVGAANSSSLVAYCIRSKLVD